MDLVDLLRLPRTVQNARRAQEVLSVLARHGAADVLRRVGLWSHWRRAEETADTGAWERRIRVALEELGPTFIKLGQLLATRPDLVGAPLARELRMLQDGAPAIPLGDVRRQLEREFGRPLSELFADFDPTSVAAASVAQVHRAKLSTGEAVAVKVRRPGLAERIARDLDILQAIAARVDEHAAEVLPLSAVDVVDELSRALRREIDLRHEASHFKQLARVHAGDPGIRCVRVFEALCGERVLTTEWVDGVRADDLEALARWGISGPELARLLLRITSVQVIEHGFFHADPHPGNVLVMPGPVVSFIDLGLVGRLQRRERDDLLELLASIVREDPERVVSLLDRMELLPRSCDLGRLEHDVQDLIEFFTHGLLHRVPLARLVGDLLDTLLRHRARVPYGYFLLAKTLAVTEGLVRELAPDLDPMQELEPIAQRLYLERMRSADFLTRDWTRTARRGARLLQRAPARIASILDQLESGELRIQVASQPHPVLLERLARGTKRLVLALLISASFVSSVLLLFVSVGPVVFGLPLSQALGFGGVAASASAAALLAVSTVGSRNG